LTEVRALPKNKLLYLGLLVIAAGALIYMGAWLAKFLIPAVPYVIAVGALMIIVGLVMESRKKAAAAESQTPPAAPTG
jgi:uncharacterized membrane protein YfcA